MSDGLERNLAAELAEPDAAKIVTESRNRLDVETYIDAAKQHGEDSEPDHEVGDLQDYLRVAWTLMTPEQRQAFAEHDDVRETLRNAVEWAEDEELVREAAAP